MPRVHLILGPSTDATEPEPTQMPALVGIALADPPTLPGGIARFTLHPHEAGQLRPARVHAVFCPLAELPGPDDETPEWFLYANLFARGFADLGTAQPDESGVYEVRATGLTPGSYRMQTVIEYHLPD